MMRICLVLIYFAMQVRECLKDMQSNFVGYDLEWKTQTDMRNRIWTSHAIWRMFGT